MSYIFNITPSAIYYNEEADIIDCHMFEICGCGRYDDLWDCERFCERYSSCDNVAIANDVLVEHERRVYFSGRLFRGKRVLIRRESAENDKLGADPKQKLVNMI